ncbi:MAG TPA: hypothetical protein VLW25_16505 [Bryobacteraceae bacterium]|nr:hypothetical protein [Bryobacteraceae bacterium]
MQLVAHLRVKSEILAVTATADHKFVTIPSGATIETSDDLVEPGFIRLTFEGNHLLAFTRDIRERTETLPLE